MTPEDKVEGSATADKSRAQKSDRTLDGVLAATDESRAQNSDQTLDGVLANVAWGIAQISDHLSYKEIYYDAI
jgi:hypothetical protein